MLTNVSKELHRIVKLGEDRVLLLLGENGHRWIWLFLVDGVNLNVFRCHRDHILDPSLYNRVIDVLAIKKESENFLERLLGLGEELLKPDKEDGDVAPLEHLECLVVDSELLLHGCFNVGANEILVL